MRIFIPNANTFLLLIFFNSFATISMFTADDDICDDVEGTSAMVHWYTQVYESTKTNQNIIQHIFDTQAKLGQVERNMEGNYKIMEEKLLQMERRMDETNEELLFQLDNNRDKTIVEQILEMKRNLEFREKTMQETHKRLETFLNAQSQYINNDIVIQRRQDGSEDFFRTWAEYKNGFGNSSGEFFIGLDTLHKLTNTRPYALLIVLEDWKNDRRYAKYDQFVIGSEKEKYVLKKLGQYSGTAADSMAYHLGNKFTTKDQDNDLKEHENCAISYTGAWWYKNCHHSNLNGLYHDGGKTKAGQGLQWLDWGDYYSVKFVEMIILPSR